MKKHEKRKNYGTRRKTSATWWRRYVLCFLQQAVLCSCWTRSKHQPHPTCTLFSRFCRTRARGRGSMRRTGNLRKRRTSSSRCCCCWVTIFPQKDTLPALLVVCTLKMYVYVCMGDLVAVDRFSNQPSPLAGDGKNRMEDQNVCGCSQYMSTAYHVEVIVVNGY